MKIPEHKRRAAATPPAPVELPAKTPPASTPRLARAPGLSPTAPHLVALPATTPRPTRSGFRRVRTDHLTAGKRFDAASARALEEIAGVAISLDGLTRLYEKALPSSGSLAPTRVRVTGSAQNGHFAYTVTFVDNMQRRVAISRRRLARHEDGSVELYRHGTWVDPDHRGRGFAAHMLRQEVGLVTALSSHPDTRLTLWAGGARNPKRSGDVQNVGVYVWANAGFEAAKEGSSLALSGDKPRCEDDPGPEVLDDVALMRRQLGHWLDEQAAAGHLSAEEVDGARRASEDFTQPYEFADLTLAARTFDVAVGDSRRPCAMGKAFLLSAHSPRWEGALFVNRGETPATDRAEAYVAAAQSRAGGAEQALTEAWIGDLRSGSDERQRRALAHIGAIGGVGMVPELNALRQDQPELGDIIRQTLLKVRGRWKPPRPKVTYYAHGGRTQAFHLPNQFADLAKLSAARLAAVAVTDANHLRAQVALQQLADRHLAKTPSTILEAATKLYARFDDDERWLARQTAVQILGKIPEEAGIDALIEASKSEDDINVMLRIYRILDVAESPAAVEPAERLATRIEVMKEEIEKALAEL